MSKSVLCFLLRVFLVSDLTFRSLIHSEYHFLYGVVYYFHSFVCSCIVFPATLIEEAVFSPLYTLASLVKDKVPIGAWVYIWALYLVSLIYLSVFVQELYCLDDCSFVV